ncbi:hypothetical protein BC830DRAFT_1122859 [Chytriomyces sp. MP71]|nr:hypothetical protein BC830DRAFT_1122859 [Chytriomyces sp. MP71]
MASSLRSPDYHPAATPVSTSLLATSATGSESLFFETQRRTSFDGAPGNNGGVVGASPLLSALSGGFVDESGFTARSPAPASAPAFVQRRTRSVTQPVTQSEELEELFYSNPASAAGYLLQHGAGTLQQQQQQGLYNGAGTLPLQQSGAFFLDEKEVSPTSTGGLNGFLGNGSADVGELGAYTRSGFSQHGDGVSGGRQHARALSHAGVFWADS